MRIARRGAAWWLASAAVVAMFAGTPLAAAQYGHGDTKTLVTNLDQTTSDRTEVGGESYHSVAVRFHTAERGLGFVLEQIRIETEAPASGLGGVEVLAAIREDVNASIGAVTVSFVPRRVRSGTTTIEAHWAELQGNRWYWLELRARQTGKQFFVATTNSNAEGGEPGSWWINNIHKQASGRYRPDWSGSLTSVDSAAKIALLGQPKYESNLHVSTSPASEGEEIPLRFTVAPALDTEVTVSYETRIESDDTATQSEFEAVTGGSVTIPAGRNVGHATIGTNDDGVDEPDFQTFTVAITGVTPGNRVLLPRGASTKASIVDDDDPPLIGMTGGDQSVAEGASATFTLTASASSEREYAIPVPVRAGANVFPGDYRTPNRVVFTPGETEKTFTVEALEDGEAEPEESLVVQLGDEAEPQDRARIVSPRPSATVRIVASTEDAPIRVGLESINYSYHEEVGEAVIAIVAQRDGTPIADRGTIVVDYEFSDTTAVSPADYTARNGSAVIAPGESRVEITIPLNNDTLPETIERFQIVLTNVSSSRPGATFDFAPTSGQVTITDTDSSGIFLKEAKENPPDGILEVFESDESVSVTQALASEVGYPFTTIAQTLQGGGTEAGSANDYIHFSNTVFFAPLDLEEEFEIMLVDDATPELVEDFYVSLLRNGISESIEITHSLLTIRIKDDDPAFRVSPETRTLEEPAGAGTRAMREVAIGIQSPMPQTVSVEWETDDGADPTPGQNRVARTGQDFAYASGTAVFRPGETEKRIQVPILGDGVVEWAKTMHVTLKNPSAGGVVADDSPLADASAQEDFPVTIADGDGPLPIALVVPETLGEGESFTVTPRMGKAHDLAVTTSVRLSPLSGQATPGSDVTATPDPLETDFASGTLTVPGSEATITAIDDNESEGAETFEVHLQVLAAPGGEYPPVEMRDRRWRVTIIDDDAASTPGVTSIQGDGSRAIRQVVKVPEGGTNQIRITLDTPPSETVTIGFRERYRDRDITVTGARSRAFDAANWSTPWVIDLSADEDADAIDGETLLRLSFETDSPEYEARSHIDRRVIIVREDDDDTDPGGAVSHVGDLPGSPSGVMIVDHAMPARHDGRSPFYVEVEFSRGIDAPAARMRDHAWKTDDMKVLRAERVDGSARRWRFRMRPFNREQVLLSLNANTPCGTSTSICSNESPAKPVVNTLRIAIPGPGHQPGVLPPGVAGDPVFDIEGERVNESAGSLDFTVTLSKALFTEASVYFATADRTARAGEDYESRSERLVFAPGDQTKTVTITIVSDATDEGVEVFRGVIGVPAGGRIRTGEALGEIANTGPMPKAWISRFGRTAAVQVAEAIEARLGAGAGPRRDIAIAGVAATGEERGDEAWERPGEAGGEAHGATLTAAELLARSNFHLAGGSERAGAPRWAFWGRVAESGFSGRESGLDIDGRVTSLVAGADTGWGAWTAGFALAHADGDGGLGSDIDVAGATLTSVHPYVGFEPSEATRLWGVVGHGEGRLRYVERVDGKAVAYGTDLEGSMAAFGARRRLHRAGEAVGLEIASEADVLLTRTRSAAASGIMGASARTSRVRALIEAEAQGGPFVTSFDLGLRYDGGDADKGFGLEAGAAVRYVVPGRPVVFQAAARTVLAHEAKDAREWAVSAAAAWNEGGTGFQLSLAPAWGDADGGPSLWEALPCEGECGREAAVRLRSSIGYGLRSPRFPGLVRPFADLAWRAESSRTARLGVGWDLTGGARVEAMVEQADEGRFMVRARVSW